MQGISHGGQLAIWGQEIGSLLKKQGAVRIGETTVASYFVHTIEASRPGVVNIIQGSDAGEVFYQRRIAKEIIHLDIFHSLGKVAHQQVAKVIKDIAVGEVLDYSGGYPFLDHMDLQTGTGGGRITGSLTYGRKESLQKAHTNHVHLAMKLTANLLGILIPLVAAVEKEIIQQGYQIRKIEGLNYVRDQGKQPVDLSAYASTSDSLLQEKRQDQGQKKSLEKQKQLGTALDLAEKVMNPAELKDILRDFYSGQGKSRHQYTGEQQSLLESMGELGLLEVKREKYYFTPKGIELKKYVEDHFLELEFHFRKLLRKVPIQPRKSQGTYKTFKGPLQIGQGKKVEPINKDEGIGEIAVPETILAAGKRWLEQGRQNGPIQERDLRHRQKRPTKSLNICLLIDASASMAGERLRAAKFLAQHLLLSTKDSVAAIIFQDRQVKLAVPFTRNLSRVQQGLKDIKPHGLTPLSSGLIYSLKYLEKMRMERECLFFIITDGIPTISFGKKDPASEALEVADEIARKGLHFGCIGLAPNKTYLEQLTRRGKGNLYIIDELQGRVLAEILQREIRRVGRNGEK